MSQEETYIPGVGNNSYGAKEGPYARRSAGGFENVHHKMNDETYVSPGGNAKAASASSQKSGGHVVGFLYSISSGMEECWMVNIGKNTIGRSSDCNICLGEMTVSKVHAYLNVRRMKSTGKLTASIQDAASSTSVFVNEKELESAEIQACKHMDVLTIGENYKLLLLLIDAEDFGLSVAENFIPAEIEEEEPEAPVTPNFNPGGNPYDHNRRRSMEDTVDASGMKYTTPGGTKFM